MVMGVAWAWPGPAARSEGEVLGRGLHLTSGWSGRGLGCLQDWCVLSSRGGLGQGKARGGTDAGVGVAIADRISGVVPHRPVTRLADPVPGSIPAEVRPVPFRSAFISGLISHATAVSS